MKSNSYTERLLPGETYHIFNRAVGSELMFRSNECYTHFLIKMKRYILPVARIHVYCLLPNHFHFLLSVRHGNELVHLPAKKEKLVRIVNQPFSNFFNSYAVSYNRIHNRKGKLFMLPFKRIMVEDDDYFMTLVDYIHRNAFYHGLIGSAKDWPYSSYPDYVNKRDSFVEKDRVIELFEGIENLI